MRRAKLAAAGETSRGQRSGYGLEDAVALAITGLSRTRQAPHAARHAGAGRFGHPGDCGAVSRQGGASAPQGWATARSSGATA